jgi:hypothetical protein
MKMNKIYQRKCLVCKDKFTPQNNIQIVCQPSCAVEYMKRQRSKEWKQQKKEIKQKLETKSEVSKSVPNSIQYLHTIKGQRQKLYFV